MLHSLLLLLNALVAIALVIVILLQRQDTALGGAFGGANLGASGVTRNPLARPTAILATVFMASSLLLAVLSTGQGRTHSVVDLTTALPTQDGPALPAADVPVVPVPLPQESR
jgi:preprotein translocase subunit SecG